MNVIMILLVFENKFDMASRKTAEAIINDCMFHVKSMGFSALRKKASSKIIVQCTEK